MHEESDSETKPVTIHQWFGVVEPPNVIFVTSIEAGCTGCTFFFPAGLRVCCTSHRSVHLMHKESIWHISFSQQAHKTASTGKKTQPMNALKWDPTQKTSWDELVHHEGDFFMLPFSWIEGRSPGHHVPTWKPVGFTRLRDAAQTRLMDAETWKVNSFSHQLTLRCFLCFFRLCFYSSCFLLGLVLRFFLLLFSYGFVGSVFFGLDDFLHFPPKIRHKTSWSEEIEEVFFPADGNCFKSWLVNLPPHEPPSRPRNKALLRAWFPSIRPY